MIQIVQKGYIPKPIIPHYRIKCDNCHTIFECDKTDTRFKMVGHGEGAQYINCPFCRVEIDSFMNGNWETTNIEDIFEEARRERKKECDT